MKSFKKTFIRTANGNYIFLTTQITTLASQTGPGNITIDLISQLEDPPVSPTRLEETKDDDLETIIDGINPAMGQKTQTQPPNVKYIPPAGQQLSNGITQVIKKVQWTLAALVPKLFVGLLASTKKQTLFQQANAKLKASLKKSKTIDMSKEIQESLAREPTVAPKSIKTLMWDLLQKELGAERKRTEKQLLKSALASVKKIFGRVQGCQHPSLQAAT
jgi:hypothetical protein